MRIVGIIPARYQSSRFPGKPLALLGGIPMIQHVVERCLQATELDQVVVATDDDRIYDLLHGLGHAVVMTATDILNGTERCWAALQQLDQADYVINIQGDEPFISPIEINRLARLCRDHQPELGTLVMDGISADDLFNPNKVKVVLNNRHEALYFSRSAIPFVRDHAQAADWVAHHRFFHHVGMYAYRSDVLGTLAQLPPGDLERAESLEQLRWLENGLRIKVALAENASMGVDTPEDLARAEALLEALPPSL